MTPEFASYVNPIIVHVLNLTGRVKAGERADLKAERYRLSTELRKLEEVAARATTATVNREYSLARQVLIYFADELITLVDQQWKNMTLEWEYYNSQDRAWKFYVDGESQARASSGNVIELWYLTLVLGFEGDIFEGFRRLSRQDFPPVQASEAEARQLWARELERQIPQRQNLGELSKPLLTGNVRPLRGTPFLVNCLQAAGVLLLILVVLAAVKLL